MDKVVNKLKISITQLSLTAIGSSTNAVKTVGKITTSHLKVIRNLL